jgi:hypothetical protein
MRRQFTGRVVQLSVGDYMSDLFRLELRCDRDAPSAARDALAQCGEIDDVREDARLLASELVTSAVVQSGCNPGQTIEVSARIGERRLVIAVGECRDAPAGAGGARLRTEHQPELAGFGLRVVDWIARSWGAERRGGPGIWAELALQR